MENTSEAMFWQAKEIEGKFHTSPFLPISLCFYTPISVGTTPFFQKKFIHLYIEKVYITYLIQKDIFGHDFRFFIG